MKQIFPLLYFLLIFTYACNKSGYDNPNRTLQRHEFPEQNMAFGMPETWSVENNMIIGPTGETEGEISMGILELKEDISTKDFLERLKNGGPSIEGTDNSFAFSRNSEVLESATIRAEGKKWIVARTEMLIEGPKDPGIWYAIYFMTHHKDQMIFINFYSQRPYPIDKQLYKDILSTVEIL